MLLPSGKIKKQNGKESIFTFVALLKTCAKEKNLCKGKRIHEDILNRGLLQEKNPHLSTSLINMYAKCGLLAKAHELLEKFSPQSVTSWSALIAGYVECECAIEALECFKLMRNRGISPDSVIFTCILKACGIERDLDQGQGVHHEIVSMGFIENDVMLGNALVDMYAKCDLLSQAHQVLGRLPIRNVVTWNTLISGYAQKSRYCHKALNCLRQMQSEGITPNGVTFICALKAIGSLGDVNKGKEIHDEIVDRNLLEKDIVLGNALVDMYVKCGLLATAKQVLEKLPMRDVISWSSLITGYAHHRQCYEALSCYEQMRGEGLCPNMVTFVSILKACASLEEIDKGKQIHEEIVERGFLEKELLIANALVDMYAKSGLIVEARQVLEELHIRDVVSWNALISGYCQQGQCDEALNCSKHMEREGLSPNAITFICILNACGRMGSINKGKQVHEDIVTRGWLEKDNVIRCAIVNMYAKCGMPLRAQQVLDEFHVRTLLVWNALIAGYTQQGQGHEALKCLERMRGEGLSPNVITLTSILKACGSVNAICKGKQIHEEIVNKGFLENGVCLNTTAVDMHTGAYSQQGQCYENIPYLATTLISMYSKCGMLAKAQEVLEKLPSRNVDTWNSLIAGYARQGQCHEALDCLEWMESEGHFANAMTFSSVLKACGNTGAIEKGKHAHGMIVSKGLLDKDIVLGNGLIDMYARCGMLAKAQEVLEELPFRNKVSWSALISGYAQHGQGHKALECFERMQTEGLSPDEITFVCVLSACSHSGLLNEAKIVFQNMTMEFSITPNVEHLTCMLVSLGCAGQIDKAMLTIRVIPSYNRNGELWLSLLGACRKWGNTRLGRLAFRYAVQLELNINELIKGQVFSLT